MKLFDKIRDILDGNDKNKINIPRKTIFQVYLLTFLEILAACLLFNGVLMIIAFVLIVVYILTLCVFYKLWRMFYSILTFAILAGAEIFVAAMVVFISY